MTDEQIIKALECCATDDGDDCFQCPYGNIVYKSGNGGCVNRCRKDVLDLINRQKAEIERLNVELKAMRGTANSYKLDNERLLQKLQQARVEAIQLKEIIENTLSNYRNSKTITYEIPEDVIDVIYCIVLNMI